LTELGTEKLQKVLARQGLGSRRELETWISAGRVSINGRRAALGDRVGPEDLIRVDGRRLARSGAQRPSRVLRYHKPVGEVCTRSDPEGRPTVFAALPRIHHGRWVAVGRLDVNTSGLLLFTDDGELANRLMHPRSAVERQYAIRVFGELSEIQSRALISGVELEGKLHRLSRVEASGGEGRNRWYNVWLSEGRNREVRRLFEAQGLVVSRLIRVAFGVQQLGRRLRSGRWEEVLPVEVNQLRESVGLQACPRPAAKRRGPGKAGRSSRPKRGPNRPIRNLRPPAL